MKEAIHFRLNEAMKLDRTKSFGTMANRRTDDRRGYANGFKPKTVNKRLDRLHLQVLQIRDTEFFPSPLERGERSERALKLAAAKMYVQGASNRKVVEMTQELCGLDISITQGSRAAEMLDDEPQAGVNLRSGL